MPELKDNSIQVRREIQRRLTGGLNRANEFLVDAARDGAPVESGHLREGIGVVTRATDQSPVAVGASQADYSAIVNKRVTPFWITAWLRMKNSFGGFFKA